MLIFLVQCMTILHRFHSNDNRGKEISVEEVSESEVTQWLHFASIDAAHTFIPKYVTGIRSTDEEVVLGTQNSFQSIPKTIPDVPAQILVFKHRILL